MAGRRPEQPLCNSAQQAPPQPQRNYDRAAGPGHNERSAKHPSDRHQCMTIHDGSASETHYFAAIGVMWRYTLPRRREAAW
jgi:hypothetical protein